MTDAALAAKREYERKWRRENREHIRQYHKKWREENPEKVKQATARYWERKAAEMKGSESNEL